MNSYEIDSKLGPVLREMEKVGVKIDVSYLAKLSLKLQNELGQLQEKIGKIIGGNVNLNSPKQLAGALYQKLKIEPRKSGIKRRQTHYSTRAEDLGKIRTLHPVVDLILKYRELAKLKNTYIDPLPKLVDKNDRLHTHYAVDTSTGRLSSKNPNLQNIPIRTEIGSEIRRAFIAEKGCKLLIADYSQIELRIVAHLANERRMCKIFQEGGDIHRAVAEELGCDRRTAKVVNFGILYGMSSYGLATTLKIPEEEAQIYIDKYFTTYQHLKSYQDKIINDTIANKYVSTMFGRKRQIPELFSPNPRLQNFGKRAAINTPIQGTAADIIKLAMCELGKELRAKSKESDTKLYALRRTPAAKLLMQVHDELVFEVPDDKIEEVAKIVKEAMENVVKLQVPIIVDLEVGNNWKETEEIR